jgi:hypothetical protein
MHVFASNDIEQDCSAAMAQGMMALTNSPKFKTEKIAVVIVNLNELSLETDLRCNHIGTTAYRVTDRVSREHVVSVYAQVDPLPITLKFLWASRLPLNSIIRDDLPHVKEILWYKEIIETCKFKPDSIKTKLKKYSGTTVSHIPEHIVL